MSKNYKLNFTRELAKPTLALASRLVMARAKKYADEVETLEKRLKTLTAAKKIPKALLKTGVLQYEN
ncbi:MAG: hypothetical protein IH891_08975, partial [Planctomycetes bacterium]|nr:hypothetical protein [Planctomycetota bacterium]